MSYLVDDIVNDQIEHFETIQEARQYVTEMLTADGGYYFTESEIAKVRIYRAVERVELDTSREQSDGIWSHSFKPIEP